MPCSEMRRRGSHLENISMLALLSVVIAGNCISIIEHPEPGRGPLGHLASLAQACHPLVSIRVVTQTQISQNIEEIELMNWA